MVGLSTSQAAVMRLTLSRVQKLTTDKTFIFILESWHKQELSIIQQLTLPTTIG